MSIVNLLERKKELERMIKAGDYATERTSPCISLYSTLYAGGTNYSMTVDVRLYPELHNQIVMLFEGLLTDWKRELRDINDKIDAINTLLEA